MTVTTASAAAAKLRRGLAALFSADLHVPFTVDISQVDLSKFGLPKDLKRRRPLIWTTQTEVLWQELRVEPDDESFRGQILAGPSGIGKSHVSLLLALRCYAERIPVLYVGDAGVFFSETERAVPRSIINIDVSLLRRFAILNADIVPEAASFEISHFSPLMQLLHDCKAVVVLDEHGHAYNQIKEQMRNPFIVFPFLMPVMYNGYRFIRCVFAGSNQAKFEGELNGTYRPCLRFVVPFTAREASLFMGSLVTPQLLPFEDYVRLTNLVPREMVRLTEEGNAEAYVSKRRSEMAENLVQMSKSLGETGSSYQNMVGTLNRLFHTSSMAMGVEPYSFLDLGYVYRRGGLGDMLVASPLCYPATLALLDLWCSVSPLSRGRLNRVRENGDAFEDFVWDVLMARGFARSGFELHCKRLGKNAATEAIDVHFSEYYISKLKSSNQALVNAEILKLLEHCDRWDLSLLYRCPKGTADVDFFVLSAGRDVLAIQSSISPLLKHSPVEVIIKIPTRFDLRITRYVYVTVNPEEGSNRRESTLAGLSHVRIVSAADWVGV